MRNYNYDLMTSSVDGNLKGVKEALSNGANINTTDDYKHTPLMCAIKNNKFEVAEYLLSKGADYKLVAVDGFSAEKFLSKDKNILTVKNQKLNFLSLN